jgi:hypothetical protein
MEPQDDMRLTNLNDHICAMGRLLAEVQQLLAHIDAGKCRERGEDGFDG